MDGGFSQMQPVLALPCRTLTVSPFSGETDICPRDKPCMLDMVVTGVTLKGNLANGLRFWNALYPLKPDVSVFMSVIPFHAPSGMVATTVNN